MSAKKYVGAAVLSVLLDYVEALFLRLISFNLFLLVLLRRVHTVRQVVVVVLNLLEGFGVDRIIVHELWMVQLTDFVVGSFAFLVGLGGVGVEHVDLFVYHLGRLL